MTGREGIDRDVLPAHVHRLFIAGDRSAEVIKLGRVRVQGAERQLTLIALTDDIYLIALVCAGGGFNRVHDLTIPKHLNRGV